MYEYIPADFDRRHLRLSSPAPMEMLSPLAQSLCAAELRAFVTERANEMAHDMGFAWTTSPARHFSCQQMHRLIGRSAATKVPLPVSTTSASNTILLDYDAALALRYWRAMCKFQLTESCDAASELQCDLTMVAIADAENVSPESLMYLEAELVGHAFLRIAGYDVPLDPRSYTLDVLTFAYADAIILEAERQTEMGSAPTSALN